MSHNIDFERRRFIGAALAGFAIPELAVSRSGSAQSGNGTSVTATNGTTTTSDSLGTLRQVAAGVLNVGYADAGPADGRPVILLHGWPYDIHSFVDVVPLLALAGYRVIVPYLRGYGTTSFLSSDTLRNGQQSALALDVIALMDALGIERAVVAGFDWAQGRRTSWRCSGRSAAWASSLSAAIRFDAGESCARNEADTDRRSSGSSSVIAHHEGNGEDGPRRSILRADRDPGGRARRRCAPVV